MIIHTQDGVWTHASWWLRGKMRQVNRALSLELPEAGIILAQCKDAWTVEALGGRFQSALISASELFDVNLELNDIAKGDMSDAADRSKK